MNLGVKTKEDIPEKPELDYSLGIYWEAFHMLDTERNHSMGPQYIPWSRVQYYADSNGFDIEQTRNLHFFIRAMDDYEVERVAKKQERDRKKAQK